MLNVVGINFKNLSTADKLLVILVIGFTVFVGGWLFGRQDFFTYGSGTCSEVWNPQPVVDAYGKYYSNGLIVDCTGAANARKDTILFGGFIVFSALTAGFLLLTSVGKSES